MPDRTGSRPFKSVQERDVDLLLLEELTVSPEFRQFFRRQLDEAPTEAAEFLGAWHSVTDSEWGESDIEMGITDVDGTHRLTMIENKIDAPFQDSQLVRYRERGTKALSEGWDAFTVCMTAPRSYLDRTDRSSEADATVSFETIREWFVDRDTSRAAFKAEMLTEAIEQNRRGYTAEPDEDVTALHRHYWSIASDRFPDLALPEPTGVPSGNLWHRFRPSTLPADVSLIHKSGKGYVDLQFSGARENEDAFRRAYEPLIEDGMEIVPAGQSLSVRLTVPPLFESDAPENQEAEMVAGLRAAETLLQWYTRVDHPLDW